ncbi:hypothetical protein C8R44DRAFT_735689 [Mycena epipterygia]|nr:hypothetical protein C8R44DRAFT_735689 [Mycena epipterygia]
MSLAANRVNVFSILQGTESSRTNRIWRLAMDETAEYVATASIDGEYIANRQPRKALTYFLRLRQPNVFDLIWDNNLFADVQDQALLLIEFDHELMKKRKQEGQVAEKSEAITLLLYHIHSILTVSFTSQQLDMRSNLAFEIGRVAYKVCDDRSLVPEMVFLLGCMGNNKQPLTRIIEKLGMSTGSSRFFVLGHRLRQAAERR